MSGRGAVAGASLDDDALRPSKRKSTSLPPPPSNPFFSLSILLLSPRSSSVCADFGDISQLSARAPAPPADPPIGDLDRARTRPPNDADDRRCCLLAAAAAAQGPSPAMLLSASFGVLITTEAGACFSFFFKTVGESRRCERDRESRQRGTADGPFALDFEGKRRGQTREEGGGGDVDCPSSSPVPLSRAASTLFRYRTSSRLCRS